MAVAQATRPILEAETAADIMTPNPISIRATATVREGIALLTERGFSAAPVIDESGRPVGVVSRTDILFHDRETARHPATVPEYYDMAEGHEEVSGEIPAEVVDNTLIADLMTPAIISVAPETPARKVIADLLAYRVHRLFVVDASGVLVGVVSALDILKHLRV